MFLHYSLAVDDLAHYPAPVQAEMARITLKTAAARMSTREVNQAGCTEYGQWADVCPTQAIIYTPTPVFGETCIFCYSCVRECPEDAIQADLSSIEGRIHERVKPLTSSP